MKYFYTTLVCAVMLVSCKDNPKIDRAKTDWEFYKLKGDVKSVSEKTKAVGQAEVAGGRETQYDIDYIFNDNGKLITEKKYLPDGKNFQEITYNGRDKIIKQIQYVNNSPSVITEYAWDKEYTNYTGIIRRNADNSQLDRVGMKYNANGKVIEKIMYGRQDTPLEKTTYDYDADGNMKAENFYLDKDAVQVSNIYKYNGPNKVSEVKVRPDGSIIYKTFFEYNQNNKLIKSGTTDGNGTLSYTKEITYDTKGNVISQTIAEAGGTNKTTDKYVYDANSNKTVWVSYMDDKPMFEIQYKYDKNNNITYMKMADTDYNLDPVIKSYTYTYDKAGNWNKKITLVNGTQSYITTRIIKYL